MKEPMNITVKTLPNGYNLRFDGMGQPNGYLYFSKEDLLKGFMLHIGLNITREIQMNNIDEFVKAATNWNDTEKCVTEIERLNSVIRIKDGSLSSLADSVVAERKRALNICTKLKNAGADVKEIEKAATEIVSKLRKLRPLDKQSLLKKISVQDKEEEQ